MAAPTKKMHQIRQILTLKNEGLGTRKITRQTQFSRNTVRDYLQRAAATGQSLSILLALDNDALSTALGLDVKSVPVPDSRLAALEGRFKYFKSELRKTGVTRLLLWEEYIKEQTDGYSYTQFCTHFRRYLDVHSAVMHLNHSPAEVLMVDFAGDCLYWVDTSSGEQIATQVLVCTFPYSSKTYVEALPSQKLADFLRGLANAITYFKGVPQGIRCDNMRTAVTKPCRYEPTFTEAFDLFCAHYQTSPLSTRVAKPRDKASVENAVNKAYQRIYAPLRNEEFHSLKELNIAVMKRLEHHNAQLLQRRDYSRNDLFEQEELPLLRPLPAHPYQIQHVTQAKVQRNYHVILGEDRHQYSVPYQLIGKTLQLIYTYDSVEIYDQLQRVAVHRRDRRPHSYSTLNDHMPANHRHWEERQGWTPDYFTNQARQIGPATLRAIERILEAKTFLEQTYNSCLGIFKLAKHYGNERLEAACLYAESAPKINYSLLNNILMNNREKVVPPESNTPVPEHENVRGSDNYQ